MSRKPDIPNRPYLPGDDLPAVCSVAHVAWVFGITPSAVHGLRERGNLQAFLLPSLGGSRFLYSGLKLKQWALGEFQPGRSFGAARHRHARSLKQSA